MENRFLQMNDYLGRVAKTRGPALLRPRRRTAAAPVPADLALPQSLRFATPFAAADRALVILIENTGVDLGIPDLVDKLLTSVPGANLLPDSTRQQLVEFIRDKIKSLTDSLLETAELSINRYAGSKPEFFGDVIVLRNGTASYTDLKQTLLAQSRQGKIIDVLILTHGGQDSIAVEGGITGQKIRDIRTELGSPLTIRSVYMMNCIGSSLNQAWLDAGARVSSGSIRNNYLPEPTTFFFWQNWKAGKPFEESVTAAYRKTINVMNEAVRGFVRSLPIPGSGSIAEAIDFETMDFVRDSAPVVQGQRSLTINADDLSAAQSTASSLATTVLHVGVLQSLRARTFEAGPRVRPISAAGVDFLKRWEGFRPSLCNENGTCTIGYGSGLHAGRCDGRPVEQPYASGISEEAATQLLTQQAGDVRQLIDESITVPLSQNQSDALISLVYDIGADAFRASTLLGRLNAGDTAGAAAEIRKWCREQRADGGHVDVPSLVTRREAEAALFLTPDTAAAQTLSPGRRLAGAFGAVDYSHSYTFQSPSIITRPRNGLSVMQNPAAAVIGIADAAQIGLAAVSIVQAQVSASQGSFVLSYDKAQRLLTSEARGQLPQIGKTNYSRRLLYLGISRLNAAEADVIIEWAGNAYGEIQTPIIRRNLDTSTEWSKSSATIAITKIDSIPMPNTDPRAWPIVYSFEGTYDPWGNGYFEFSGEFEVNAFGGLKFNRHQVVSRAFADFALSGTPDQYVQRGADAAVAVPPIPEEQLAFLRKNLPL